LSKELPLTFFYVKSGKGRNEMCAMLSEGTEAMKKESVL
jgi:hypothetical protein